MAKDDEKYRWDWAAQSFPTIDPHSKIKHQIIDEYIQTYIDVLMRNQLMPELGLSIVDGFRDAPINLSCSRGKLQFSRHLQRHWTKSDRKIMYGELFRPVLRVKREPHPYP